jgi:cell division protein FtsB
MSIRDSLRVIALEKQVSELQTQLDQLAQRQDELESAWREASRPRGATAQPMATNDARKAQGRY